MRILILTLVTSLFVVACSKDNGCKSVPPEEEKAELEAYNKSHGINGTAHYSGLYYEVLEPGASLKPTRASTVFVKYTGKKFDGTVFDSQSNPGATGFALSNLIEGWKIGIPMVGKGGHILLTVPSGLAYGCVGSNSDTSNIIEPNIPLFFDIELVDFY